MRPAISESRADAAGTTEVVAGLHCPSWAPTRTLLIQSVPLGQRFRSTCPETVTYRASVPAFLPQNARFCPEKL